MRKIYFVLMSLLMSLSMYAHTEVYKDGLELASASAADVHYTSSNSSTDYTDLVGLSPNFSKNAKLMADPVRVYSDNALTMLLSSHTTIQSGVTAAVAGNFVVVDAGTYNEAVNINKSLTLRGANVGIPGNGVRLTESIIGVLGGFTVSGQNLTVTIDGFKFVSSTTTRCIVPSSGAATSDVIFQNNLVEGRNVFYSDDLSNMRDVTFNSNKINNATIPLANNVSAIIIFSLRNLTVTDNEFSDIGFNAIQSTGSKQNVNITNNTFTNIKREAVKLVGSIVDGNVTNNTIVNANFDKIADRGGIGISSVVLPYKVNIANNRIENSFNGVSAQNSMPANNLAGADIKINNNYLVSNVPGSKGIYNNGMGTMNDATCNYYGSTDYATVDSKIYGKVIFVPYSTSDGGPCNEKNAIPASLALTYTAVGENVQVQFNVTQNDLQLRPIPLLNPAVPADLVTIAGLYNDLKVAIAGGNSSQIQAAALAVGDDIITEYYYMNGPTRVYLKTAGSNDLIKNKYWDKYLVRTSNSERLPDWGATKTLITKDLYNTSTNPLTGAVSPGWLNNVLGKDLHVDVTFVHNGSVTTIQKTVAIPGPVKVYSGLPIGAGTFINSYVTIQAAIDAATTNAGYIIEVDAGTYNEGQLLVNKELKIRGANAGNAGNDIRVAESVVTDSYILISKNNVEIDGFKFTGTPPTYPVHSAQIGNGGAGGPKPSHGVIKNNFFEKVANNAIFLTSVDDWTIERNRFQGIGNVTGSLGTPVYSAMSLYYGVTNVTIKDNVLNTVDYNGILVNPGHDVIITRNSFTNIQMSGVQLSEACGNVSVTENTFVNANIVDQADRGVIRIYGQLFDGPINISGNVITGGVAGFAVKSGNNIAGKDIHFNNNSITGSTSGTAIRHMGTGTLDATCNWYGSTAYIDVDSKIKGKVKFVPYSTSDGGPCNEKNAIPASLALTYTAAGENVQVQFNVTQNDLQLRPIPNLDPNVSGDLLLIAGLYNDLKVALDGNDPVAIQEAALVVGDDIITEYYYMNGMTKVYLKTTGGNDLIKNKYWDKYLVRTSNSERLPDWGMGKTLVTEDQYATSTNPLTGAVSSGWLNDVLGKDLHVDVTFVHNGKVTTVQQTVAIGLGPVNVYSALPVGPATFVSSHIKIQAAIDAATTMGGYVVTVDAGTYAENLLVNKSLEIYGAGQGLTTIIPSFVGAIPPSCPGSDCAGASNVIKLAANNIHLHDFSIDGNNPGLTSGVVVGGQDIDARNGIIADGNTRSNIEINNITISNIYLRGLYPQYTTGMNVHNNTVSNVRGSASSIAIFSWASSGTVSNNTVSDANDAIAANHSLGITFSGNNVSNSASGIHSDNNGDGSPSTADIITGNTVTNGSGAGSYGIWVFVPYLNTVVSNNTITNVHVALTTTGALGATPTVTMSGNSVNGMGLAGSTGAYFTTSTFGYGDGVNKTIFTNNNITGTSQLMELEANTGFTNNLVANNNAFSNNSVGVVKTGAGTFTEDLNCNWWGSSSAASVMAAAGAGTNYSPWLTNGTDDQPLTSGFQPVSGSCTGVYPVRVYSDNTFATLLSSHTTIQSGVNAAVAGNAVVADAGVYPESITINKTITLLGANDAISPNTGIRVPESIIMPSSGAAITGTTNGVIATVKGFTIDMANSQGANGHFLSQVSKTGTQWTFGNNIFQNAGDPDIGNIKITGASTGLKFTLTDNLIQNNAVSNGISIWDNASFDIDVQNNVWKDNGAHALNLNGAQGIIKGNIFKETRTVDVNDPGYLWYNYQGGILLSDPGFNLNIVENEFSKVHSGVILYADVAGMINIKNNLFDGAYQYSIRASNSEAGSHGPSNLTEVIVTENSFINYNGVDKNISNARADNALLTTTCNWFESADPLVVQSKVSANVSVETILNVGTDGNSEVGFQPNGTCICSSGNLVTNTTSLETFCTIQAAIDAPNTLNGHTITVGAGNYFEEVDITKSLTINGPNAGISPNGGVRGPEAILYQSPNPSFPTFGFIFAVGASNVTIDGFFFDGDNTSVASGDAGATSGNLDSEVGIYMYEDINNLKVENNILQNIVYSGVLIQGPGSIATTGHVISDNLFHHLGTYSASNAYGFFGNGVIIQNSHYANIKDNVMTNVRLGVQTGNFSKANPGAAPSQVISGNTIQARRTGIFHNLHYGTASPITLSNNTITGLANANESGVRGMLFGSLSVPSYAINNSINLSAISVASTGYEVWNVKNTTPVSITEGLVSGVNTGIFLNNFEGYNSDATDGAHATITGVNITPKSGGIGIRLLDSPSSTTHANVQATATNNFITGGVDGVKLEESVASKVTGTITNNSITGQNGKAINGTNVANLIAATCNWYGSPSPAAVMALISGIVTYSPWLIGGTDDGNSNNGFQPQSACSGVMPSVDIRVRWLLPFNGAFILNEIKDAVLRLNEIGGLATNGTITITIPSRSGYNYSFVQAQTTATNPNTTVQNSDPSFNWQATVSPGGALTLTSTNGSIPPNGEIKLAIKVTSVSNLTSTTLRANLATGSGGDNNTTNNIILTGISTN